MRYLILIFLTLSALAQTRSVVNTGAAANDGTGDTLRTFGGKVNTNFYQLWETVYTNGVAVRGGTNNLTQSWNLLGRTNTVDIELEELRRFQATATDSAVTGISSLYLDGGTTTLRASTNLQFITPAVLGLTAEVGDVFTLTDRTNGTVEFQSLGAALKANVGNPALSVGTIADLIASTGSADYIVATKGYHTAGDGGHGLYRWTNSLPSGVSTNLGTWFAGASGYWGLIHNGRVNVRQFGAKGDGVTDDVAILNAAFTAIKDENNDADGRTLIVPAGRYLVGSQVEWFFAVNFTVEFQGDAEIVLDPSPSAAVDQVLRIHSVTNATFINVSIDCSGYEGANGIGIGRATGSNKSRNVRVFNSRVRNCYRAPAVSLSPPANAGGGRAVTIQFDVFDVTIDGLIATDCTTAIDTHGNSDYPIIGAVFRDIYAIRCEEVGSFYDLLDQDTNKDKQGYNQILVDGVMAVDCGLSTAALESGTTYPTGTMGGLFVFVRARSVTVNNVKAHNSSSYGQIGAIARGTGKHIRMRNVDANVDTVALFWLYKAENMLPLNSVSDDGIQPYQWRISDVRHTGSTTNVVLANQSGISPPLSQCSFENIDLDVLLGNIVGDGPALGSGGSSSFLSVREKSTTKTIEGNLSNIQIFHPNFDIVNGISMARAGHMLVNQAMVYASNSTPFLILNRQGTSSGAASLAVNSGSIRFFDDARTTYRYEFPQSGLGVLLAPDGISGGTHGSAALEVRSTTKGLLPPRITEAERDLISTPANGLMIYNSTTDKLQVRAAGSWVDLH